MRVTQIVRLLCRPCLELVHATRLAAVFATLNAIISSRRLSVTSIGRAIDSSAFPKHSIKRVDRLLSNPQMWVDRHKFFAAMAQVVLGTSQRPVILLDWTKCNDLYVLLAAAPFRSTSKPIPKGCSETSAYSASFSRLFSASCLPLVGRSSSPTPAFRVPSFTACSD